MQEEKCCGENISLESISTLLEDIVDQETPEEKELKFLSNKEENSQIRLDICKSCPSLKQPLNRCGYCGCFMNIKVRIASSVCPIGKW